MFDYLWIAYRSILQRATPSWLTMISMALGVMLVVMVLTIHGLVETSFRNNSSLGYNMIVGAKGGREQLTLNTVFYLSQPVENIETVYYAEFMKQPERDAQVKNSFGWQSQQLRAAAQELALLATGDAPSMLAQKAAQAALPEVALATTPRGRGAKGQDWLEVGRDGKYGLYCDLVIPVCLGDYLGRFRVVGTTPALFNDLVYDLDNNRKYEFAQGRNFEEWNEEHGYYEAVLGSHAARELEKKVGDVIHPTHGSQEGHTHAQGFTVVGILKPSGTPNDRAVFVNMEGFYLMEDHAKPLEEEPIVGSEAEEEAAARAVSLAEEKQAAKAAPESTPAVRRKTPLPLEQREVTALLVKTVKPVVSIGLQTAVNEGKEAQAVLPVGVIYSIFDFIVNPVRNLLLFLTAMICLVSGMNILVGIYNSMSERKHEIAIMRALGAHQTAVGTIICLEAVLLALGGGGLGWFCGHFLTLLASPIIEERTGVVLGWDWKSWFWPEPLIGWEDGFMFPAEWLVIPALILLAIAVGFWPARTAYQTDVAGSLEK